MYRKLIIKKEWFVLNWMLINERVQPLFFRIQFTKYRMIVHSILSEIYVTGLDI